MCGICGVLNFDRESNVDRENLHRMNTTLSHRGPDEAGYYIHGNVGLAMRRLKIIDLKTGTQPIFSEDKNICVVFNGEIYNYQSLRDNLIQMGHTFQTESDTEVIVHLYEEYYDDCVHHLRGMFAFALWDGKENRLLLARDRLGIKPMHYYYDSDLFVFGSEIKALVQHPFVTRELDHDSLYSFLSLSYVPTPKTIFKNILKLPPGHCLVCDEEGIKVEEYWDLEFNGSNRLSKSGLYEQLMELLQESVQLHLRSDVPLGSFLSGGVDSSAVVALASRALTQPLRTFTIGFEDQRFNESHDAQFVADYFQTQHMQFVLKDKTFDPDVINEIFKHVDEPFADSSMIPTYLLSKLTKSEVKVALSGDGGDELFGGYPIYQYVSALDNLKKLPVGLKGMLLWLLKVASTPGFMASGELVRKVRKFASLFDLSDKEVYVFLKSLFLLEDKEHILTRQFRDSIKEHNMTQFLNGHLKKVQYKSLVDQLLYLDLKVSLPDDMLTKVDRMSMLNSLEVRVPLLDHKVVEFAAGIPTHLKIHLFRKKYVFKRAIRKILPPRIINKRKMGFEIPLHKWASKRMIEFIQETLDEQLIKSQGIFQWKEVKRLVEMFRSNDDEFKTDLSRYQVNQRLWILLSFQLWYQKYFC